MEQINNIQSFSIKRILLLMQKTAFENAKFTLIGMTSIFGFFSIILFFNALSGGDSWQDMHSFYVAGFIISGIIISGMAFTSFRSKEKTMGYLMLPASTLEKLISELLMTTVVFAIAYTIIFYVFNLLVFVIGAQFNIQTEIISLLDMNILNGFMYYVIFQSIFLAGSATFKKAPIFLTSFTFFAAGIAITIFALIITVAIMGDFNNMTMMNINIGPESFSEQDIENHFLLQAPKYMFYFLTAPVFWLVTYFKIKEKEA